MHKYTVTKTFPGATAIRSTPSAREALDFYSAADERWPLDVRIEIDGRAVGINSLIVAAASEQLDAHGASPL